MLPISIKRKRQGGQIIVMVTLALLAMCGLMALAIDLGWSYFVKQSAQGASDAAALSAVAAGQALVATPPPYSCSATGLDCTSGGAPVACSSISNTSNLYRACQYAQSHGFQHGVNNVGVTVAANVCSGGIGCPSGGVQPPTVTNVAVSYWVTVRVNQNVPQLFAAVVGNGNANVAARSTAALTRMVFDASITLLNRQNEPLWVGNQQRTGTNLDQSGGGSIQAPRGMLLASNSSTAAATQNGSSTIINTPFSIFRGAGACVASGSGTCNWNSPWTNEVQTGTRPSAAFEDPTSLGGGLGQPTLDPAEGVARRVYDDFGSGASRGTLQAGNPPGATGAGTAADPVILPPGDYYTCAGSSGTCSPTGAPMRFDNKYYRFQGTGANDQYVFYGGLNTSTGSKDIQFSPGRYVFNGVTSPSTPSFEVTNNTVLRDTNSGGSYAGEIFIFTSPSSVYGSSHAAPAELSPILSSFGFGESGFKMGNCSGCSVSLTGLDAANAPSQLQAWAPYLMWQDRANSYVKYNGNGTIDWGGGSGTCGPGSSPMNAGVALSLDNPCRSQVPLDSNTPRMYLYATPNTLMRGAIYQPRGAWLDMQGGGNITGDLKIVTGAITVGGSSSILLSGLGAPITIHTVALIE